MKTKIKELIKQKGMTQKEVAEKLNIKESSISQWIKEKTTPSLDRAYQLSLILDCSIDDMIVKEAPEPPQEAENPEKQLEQLFHSLSLQEKRALIDLATTYRSMMPFRHETPGNRTPDNLIKRFYPKTLAKNRNHAILSINGAIAPTYFIGRVTA